MKGLPHFFARAPRPFVVWTVVQEKQAVRLYRWQHMIWVWLGIAAASASAAYFARPTFGPVVVSRSAVLDVIRVVLFAVGGLLIAGGVWWVRRAVEVVGHVLFATAVALNVVAAFSVPLGAVAVGYQVALLAGLGVVSLFRAVFIVEWIGSAHDAGSG